MCLTRLESHLCTNIRAQLIPEHITSTNINKHTVISIKVIVKYACREIDVRNGRLIIHFFIGLYYKL